MLDNKFVQASAYIARGYARLVLDKDFAAFAADLAQGLSTAGLDKFLQDHIDLSAFAS